MCLFENKGSWRQNGQTALPQPLCPPSASALALWHPPQSPRPSFQPQRGDYKVCAQLSSTNAGIWGQRCGLLCWGPMCGSAVVE